jgi:hypothetical protein
MISDCRLKDSKGRETSLKIDNWKLEIGNGRKCQLARFDQKYSSLCTFISCKVWVGMVESSQQGLLGVSRCGRSGSQWK